MPSGNRWDDPSKDALHRRFDRFARLVGDPAMTRLEASHVTVFGIGGVGSFAAEALVRSGVGRVTIVDFDVICPTNTNRQLHTLSSNVGEPKVDVFGERLRAINPEARIDAVRTAYDADSSASLLGIGNRAPDFVVDAIDNITAKTHLIATCRAREVPIVVSGGAAGRLDPTRVVVADLTATEGDPFAKAVRKVLRAKHGFPRKGPFGVPTVYSEEPPRAPLEVAHAPVRPEEASAVRRKLVPSAVFVTATFGLTTASVVIRGLL